MRHNGRQQPKHQGDGIETPVDFPKYDYKESSRWGNIQRGN